MPAAPEPEPGQVELAGTWKIEGLPPVGSKITSCNPIHCVFEFDRKVTMDDAKAVAKALVKAGWKHEETDEGSVSSIRLTKPSLHSEIPISMEDGETIVIFGGHPNVERRLSVMVNMTQ